MSCQESGRLRSRPPLEDPPLRGSVCSAVWRVAAKSWRVRRYCAALVHTKCVSLTAPSCGKQRAGDALAYCQLTVKSGTLGGTGM